MTTKTVHHTHRKTYGNARYTLAVIALIGLGYASLISSFIG